MAAKKQVVKETPAQREVRRLAIKYKEEVIPQMMKKFNWKKERVVCN